MLVAALGVALVGPLGVHALDWVPVVRSGEPAPGSSPGVTLDDPWIVSTNLGRSDFVFGSTNSDSSPGHPTIYRWSEESGSVEVAAIDLTTRFLWEIVANASGDIAFSAIADSAFDDCHPYYHLTDAPLFYGAQGEAFVELFGSGPVPGAPEGWTDAGIIDPAALGSTPLRMGPNASLAFSRVLSVACGSDSTAILAPDGQGGTAMVARSGTLATGTSGGLEFESFEWGDHPLNDSGQIAFRARLNGDQGQFMGYAIYRWDPGVGLSLLVRAGTPTPSGDETWGHFGLPVIDEAGEIAFFADAGPSPEAERWGLWLVTQEGVVSEVIRENDPLSGGPENARFSEAYCGTDPCQSGRPEPVLMGTGRVAFEGLYLVPGTGYFGGLFVSDSSGAVELRLKEGDVAPGSGGLRVERMVALQSNDDGDLLLWARLVELGSGFSSDAIYLLRASGRLQLLIQDGEPLEFSDGVPEPVELSFPIVAPDISRIALKLRSSTGAHAIFYATVPEAAVTLSASTALISLLWLRRCR